MTTFSDASLDEKRFFQETRVPVLIWEGKCLHRRAKPAHFRRHLPTAWTPHLREVVRVSRKVDESGLRFLEVAFLAASQHPLAQRLEARSTIRLALDELQAMHMTLDRPLRPGKRESGFHCRVIFFERLRKAA